MVKLKSPLKEARLQMDLSRSELASLMYPGRDSSVDKAELSQAIARCEAGLLDPEDVSMKYLFKLLANQGYKNLQSEQKNWINARKNKIGRNQG